MARKHKHDDNAAQASANSAGAGAPTEAEEAEESGGGGAGKLLFLLLLGGVLAMVLSKDLRSKVLDALFGAEEEFDYSSTTMPASDFSSVGAPAS
jgi:hypothetical protein